MSEHLEAAYRATTYRVFLPAGAIDLRLGEASPVLAAWLAEEGVSTWAILTACNPASQPLAPAENAERQSQLECTLLEQGLLTFAGENVADDGVWPNEESCFVPGVELKNSVALARRFGQNALILGGEDGVPHLVWLNEEQKPR